MKTPNTFGVRFLLKKSKKSKRLSGRSPIYARITVNGRRVDLSVKHFIDDDRWSVKKGQAIGKTDDACALNSFLEKLRSELVKSYQDLVLQRRLITALAVKNAFLGEQEEEHTLKNLLHYHRIQQEHSIAKGTMKNYGATEHYLLRFLKAKLRTDDIYLSQLSYRFIIDFEAYLRTTPGLDEKRPLTNNGLMKHMERFKKLTNLAVRLEWMERNPFDKYKLKFIEVDRQSLNKEELEHIEQLELKTETLNRVRDMFVFSCYTGLAYIDVVSLKAEDIGTGIDGGQWIFIRRKKSRKPAPVPLLPNAQEIAERHKNHTGSIAFGTVFPMISNQKTNQYLKDIAREAGIEKDLTFHIARHTFATTVTLTNGVPIESVSKMLGHTSIRTTQIYAKVMEQKIAKDMADLRMKLLKSIPVKPAKLRTKERF